MKKRVTVTHFTTKTVRTELYITYNKKILFIKKYLSLSLAQKVDNPLDRQATMKNCKRTLLSVVYYVCNNVTF